MVKEVAHQGYEYRVQGRQVHRRPIDREGLPPWEASWLVMDQPHLIAQVPEIIQQQFAQPEGTHFD